MEIKKLTAAEAQGATVIGGQIELGTYRITGMKAEEILVIKKTAASKDGKVAAKEQKFILLELSGQCSKDNISIGMQRISVPYVQGWAEATDENSTVTVEVFNVLNADGTPKLSASGYPIQRTRIISVEAPA